MRPVPHKVTRCVDLSVGFRHYFFQVRACSSVPPSCASISHSSAFIRFFSSSSSARRSLSDSVVSTDCFSDSEDSMPSGAHTNLFLNHSAEFLSLLRFYSICSFSSTMFFGLGRSILKTTGLPPTSHMNCKNDFTFSNFTYFSGAFNAILNSLSISSSKMP